MCTQNFTHTRGPTEWTCLVRWCVKLSSGAIQIRYVLLKYRHPRKYGDGGGEGERKERGRREEAERGRREERERKQREEAERGSRERKERDGERKQRDEGERQNKG